VTELLPGAAAAAAPPAVAEQPDVSVAEPELPPLDSLGSASDYTAFLQKGVSAEVQRLALHQAWRSDESIAGFRGMAEYAWDFNTPEYGRLWAADDLAKLVQAVISPPADDPPAVEHAASPEAPEAIEFQPEAVEPAPDVVAEIEPAPKEPALRRHGSALPC
jgi:hypothetical protein